MKCFCIIDQSRVSKKVCHQYKILRTYINVVYFLMLGWVVYKCIVADVLWVVSQWRWWWWWSLLIIWMMSAVSTWLVLMQTGSGGMSQRHSMSLPSDQTDRRSPTLSVRAPKLHVISIQQQRLDCIHLKITTSYKIIYF